MTKEECEYCHDEDDCEAAEHTIDCIFCSCQDKYPSNITCEYCGHDMSWCECPEEEVQKRFDALIEKLREQSEEFRKEWDALSKSGTE